MTPKIEKKVWLEEAKLTINQSMNKAKDRFGFVSYWKNREAIIGTILVVRDAEKALANNEYEKALELSLLVISAMTILRRHNDDSDGDTGALIHQANDVLKKLSQSIGPESTDMFVKRVLKEAIMKKYDEGYDVRGDLFNIAAEAVQNETDAKPLLKTLLLYMNPKGKYNVEYIYASLAYLIVLKKLKQFDEMKAMINKLIEHDKIRSFAIELALENQDYEEVLRLADQGEQLNKGFLRQNQWLGSKMQAYIGLNRMDEAKDCAYKLAIDGEMFYYRLLKQMCSTQEWEQRCLKLLNALEKENLYWSFYQEVLVEEKQWPRLILSIEKRPETIKQYYPDVKAVDPERANILYTRLIMRSAQAAKNRLAYKGVVSLIKKFAKLNNKASAETIVHTLIHLYPKKPALLDELESILFK